MLFRSSVYGSGITVDGLKLSDNSTLEFYTTSGQLCGRGSYTNQMLKFSPVYGYNDQELQTRAYPKQGNSINVMINGHQVYPSLTWTGNGGRTKLKSFFSSTEAAETDNIPTDYYLGQNYPNPFNPGTTIEFSLPTSGNVEISIYNLLGQKVRTLTNQYFGAGNHIVEWDGTADNGVSSSSGIYLYQIKSQRFIQSKKMNLVK